MYKVCFLAASDATHLSKTFTYKKYIGVPELVLNAMPYPQVRNFDSFEAEFETLGELYPTFEARAEDGNCILVGLPQRELNNESRAGLVERTQQVNLLIFDFDRVEHVTLDLACIALGLGQTTTIRQYSASDGLPNKEGLCAHTLSLLEKPVAPDVLRSWMMHQNFSNPLLRQSLRLTNSKVALSYPLDITLCQPSRIVYIAPPIFNGLDDPHKEDRTCLVQGKNETVALDFTSVPQKRELDRMRVELINELREKENLPPMEHRTTTRKGYDGQSYKVLLDPGEVVISDVTEARGFTYMNINGGDSLAYFHPSNNPKLLYNFKGEEVLPIDKINPDYFNRAQLRMRELQREERDADRRAEEELNIETADGMFRPLQKENIDELGEPHHFYFTDDFTSQYKRGTYNPATQSIELSTVATRQQVADVAVQFGLPEPNFIPRCKVEFDPTRMEVYQLLQRGMGWLNIHSPSVYLRCYEHGSYDIPSATFSLLMHLMNNDQLFVMHFCNWLAFTLQTGMKPQTAWLFSGTTGTGKGTLFHKILTPLFGEYQCMSRRLDQLEDKFDGELTHTRILWLDEARATMVRGLQKIFDKVNNLITEDRVPIRKLYTEHATYPSYLAIIAATNLFNAIEIPYNDRRWNIPPRQEIPLRDAMLGVGPKLHAALHDELQQFMNYLMNIKVNEEAVRVPMESRAKEELQAATVDSPSEIISRLRRGDFGYFVDLLPSVNSYIDAQLSQDVEPKIRAFVNVLDLIVDAIENNGGEINIARSELMSIFNATVGWSHSEIDPTKFTKALNKYGLHLVKARVSYYPADSMNQRPLAPSAQFKFKDDKDARVFFKKFYSNKNRMKVVK